MQHGGTADTEADDCSQRGEQQEVRAKMEKVSEDGGHGEDKSKHIEPERGANGQIFAETEFEQESGQSNGSDDDKSERAEERGTAGVDHHQSECDQQQTCGNDAPAAGLGRAGRIGSGVGQGVPSPYTGQRAKFSNGLGFRLPDLVREPLPILKPPECRVFSSPLPIQSRGFFIVSTAFLSPLSRPPATGLAEYPHDSWRKGQLRRLADCLRFFLTNPAGREAAGKTANKRIEQRYQWRKIARDLEKM